MADGSCISRLTEIDLFVYLYDIVIFSKALEEHEKKLNRIMKRLEKENLVLEPKVPLFTKKR